MDSLVRVHTDTDEILWIDYVRVSALQIDWLHGVHMMNVNAPIDRVFAVPHVEAVVSNDDLIADRLPFATFVESLVHPTVSAEGSLAYPLLNSQVSVSREIVV